MHRQPETGGTCGKVSNLGWFLRCWIDWGLFFWMACAHPKTIMALFNRKGSAFFFCFSANKCVRCEVTSREVEKKSISQEGFIGVFYKRFLSHFYLYKLNLVRKCLFWKFCSLLKKGIPQNSTYFEGWKWIPNDKSTKTHQQEHLINYLFTFRTRNISDSIQSYNIS